MGVRAGYLAVSSEQLERMKDQSGSSEELWERVEGPWEQAADADMWGFPKAWDALWWLLDPARRRGNEEPSNAFGRAVVGARPLNPAFTRAHEDPQGLDVPGCITEVTRYLDASEVVEAARALASLAPEDLLGLYDPDAMKAASGYWVGTLSLSVAMEYVEALTAFYMRASKRRWAVIICID